MNTEKSTQPTVSDAVFYKLGDLFDSYTAYARVNGDTEADRARIRADINKLVFAAPTVSDGWVIVPMSEARFISHAPLEAGQPDLQAKPTSEQIYTAWEGAGCPCNLKMFTAIVKATLHEFARPAEPTAHAILGAVARGWCHPVNAKKVMDEDLAIAIAAEVHDLISQPAHPAVPPTIYKPWSATTDREMLQTLHQEFESGFIRCSRCDEQEEMKSTDPASMLRDYLARPAQPKS